MELRTLKYFLTVASELNITKAARKLNISQPPLSRQLSLLEEELGVQLFVRGKRRIQLTEEGKYLAQQAEHILNLAEHTAQQLEARKCLRHLNSPSPSFMRGIRACFLRHFIP